MNEPIIDVLLVEDNPGDARLFQEMLRHRSGFRIHHVYCLADGAEHLAARRTDIILLDLGLPDSQGLNTLRELIKTASALPVVVLTGNDDEAAGETAIREGAQDYLVKGRVDEYTLTRAIRYAIERVRESEALRESNGRFQSLYENVPIGLYRTTPQGQTLMANPALLEMLGYKSFEELARENMIERDYEPEYPRGWFLEQIERQGHVRDVECRWRRRDGSAIFVRESARAIRDEKGKTIYYDGFVENITERRQADEDMRVLQDQLRQSQKVEAIGQLAGGIAHDFNNALTVILGNAQMGLTDVDKNHPHYEMLEEIKEAGERASNLTRQLLAFGRRQVFQTEVINLNEGVLRIEKMLSRIIGENISLTTDLTPDLCLIEADPGQIEQVIMNLVVNARDAMPEGGRLAIETRNVELDEKYGRAHVDVKPGFYAMLVVSDTGIGMTKEVQGRIFEPFFTTKEKGKGTGLGLSTVYGIVKQSEGNISVYSEPAKGTAFKIFLPRAENTAPRQKDARKKVQIPNGSETVLAVEDEEMVSNIVRKSLVNCGYKVISAPDGEKALRICREHKGPIHLLLTDVVMPGISGQELARQAKELRPHLRVLFMSGYTDNAIVQHCILEKGMAFIQKPFTPQNLARKVREAIEN